MVSSINQFNTGNVYQTTQPKEATQVAQLEPNSENSPIEIQELPNVSNQTLEIRKFTDGIKGANEMIGAMQIADITINAISNQLKSGTTDVSTLDSTAKAAQFKSEPLFGKELNLQLAGESISVSLPLPSQLGEFLPNKLSEKHDEIMEKMTAISGLIEKASLPISNNSENYDFENFDANTFKGLFK